MRLTCILSFHKQYRRINGRLYTGKKALVPHVTTGRKVTAVKWMLNEARNKVILDNPYLTQAEEHGSMKALKPSHERFRDYLDKNAIKRWQKSRPDRSIEEHLDHLNVNKKWE